MKLLPVTTSIVFYIISSVSSLHLIPLKNGTFIYVSDAELEEMAAEPNGFSYNPRESVHFIRHYFPLGTDIKERREIIIGDMLSLNRSKYDPTIPTKLIIHGWNAGANEDSIEWPANAFLGCKEAYNVIEVDWRKGSNTINYVTAKLRDSPTGQMVADFISFLVNDAGAKINDFEVIGFSLGAHVAAFAGKYLDGELPIIVGLDPAGPLYTLGNPGARLNKGDAKFVEVIHTCAELLGFTQPIGDVDFYPNGGIVQNGCGFDWNGGCSHARSWLYYSEAIHSELGFWGRKCRDYASIKSSGCKNKEEPRRLFVLRPHDEENLVRGVYWFKTNKKGPYAVGYQ